MIKLAGLITEKKELGGALINKIERLTDSNNHNMARRVLAMAMGNKKLASVYGSMEEINVALGHLPPELSKLRNKLDKDLFKQAKKTYSDYDVIHGVF
jgi:hypothetical protein